MKEAIIYLLFDNWCNSEHEPEVKEAMDKAIQNPTEDTIFQLSSITEGTLPALPVARTTFCIGYLIN